MPASLVWCQPRSLSYPSFTGFDRKCAGHSGLVPLPGPFFCTSVSQLSLSLRVLLGGAALSTYNIHLACLVRNRLRGWAPASSLRAKSSLSRLQFLSVPFGRTGAKGCKTHLAKQARADFGTGNPQIQVPGLSQRGTDSSVLSDPTTCCAL